MENLPLPVTNIKKTKEEWLFIAVKYEDYKFKDILCDYVDSIKQWLDDNDNKMKYIGDINKIYDDIINILYERKYEGKNDREEFYEYFTLKYSRDIFNLHSSLMLIISHYIDDSLIDDDYTMIFDYLFDNLDMDDDFIKDDENDEIIDDYLSDYSTPFIE